MSMLARNIRTALSGLDATLTSAEGRYFVEGEPIAEIAERVRGVFGVHSVSPALECDKDMQVIGNTAIELMRALSGSFKVSARRSDKTFALDSMELNREVAGLFCPHILICKLMFTIPIIRWMTGRLCARSELRRLSPRVRASSPCSIRRGGLPRKCWSG